MTVFFTSDQHYGHANVIPHCARPFTDVDQMDATLTQRFNSRVSSADTTYHLGDFSFRGVAAQRQYLNRLNGRHILIRGNHDRTVTSMLSIGFAEVHNSLRLSLDSGRLFLRHLPPKAYKGDDDRDFERCLLAEPLEPVDIWLCGHVHEQWRYKAALLPIINVGVDQWGFAPVTLAELLAIRDS